MIVVVVAVIAAVSSVVVIGLGSRATKGSRRQELAASAALAPGTKAAAAETLGPVTLRDFQVSTESTTVAHGTVTFQISNAGTVQHALLVFRSDLAPGAYPMQAGNINEEGPVRRLLGLPDLQEVGDDRVASVVRCAPMPAT